MGLATSSEKGTFDFNSIQSVLEDKSNFNKQFRDLSWASAVTSVALAKANYVWHQWILFFFGAEQRTPWPLSMISWQEGFRYFFGTFQADEVPCHHDLMRRRSG